MNVAVKNIIGLPWRGPGTALRPGMDPMEMMKAAGLDWTVRLIPGYATIDGKKYSMNHCPMVRSKDNMVMDEVPQDWNTVQNKTAFEFFNDMVVAGDMEMVAAGEFNDGRIVWAQAKINESIELFGGKDVIDSYLLFTNPHIYGWSTSVSLTAMRISCLNSLLLSLTVSGKNEKIVRVTHRNVFVGDEVKEIMGLSKEKMTKYKQMAEFLAAKKATKENNVIYLNKLFPVLTTKAKSLKEMSKSARVCFETLDTQPGAEFGAGTWWQSYNSVTHYIDHIHGRSEGTRLENAWYGEGRKKKIKALELAVQFADAA